MTVKDFRFRRDFLKHTNYKYGYHVYNGMETVSDKFGGTLPDSVIKLLYHIYTENAALNDKIESKCEGE